MEEPRSIARELDALEEVGRVSVDAQRPVHAGFGFSAIKRDPQMADAQPRRSMADTPDVAEDLDAALDRLKTRAATE
jgi:hypothetical protein